MAKGYKCVLTVGGETVGKARDVELSADSNEIGKTTRESNGWNEWEQGHKNWSISAEELWVPSDSGLQALRSSYLNGTELAVELKDENGYGFSGTVYVASMGVSQPLEGSVVMPATLKGTGALAVVTPAS